MLTIWALNGLKDWSFGDVYDPPLPGSQESRSCCLLLVDGHLNNRGAPVESNDNHIGKW